MSRFPIRMTESGRRMKGFAGRGLVLFFLWVFWAPIFPSDTAHQEKITDELRDILETCGAYCERLEKASLYFVCAEEIVERIFYRPVRQSIYRTPSFFYKNTYIYDYQLIRKDKKITETRTLIEENGRRKEEKNAALRLQRFRHSRIIFGPIGILSREQQRLYDFTILKQDKLGKEQVIIIEAVPEKDLDVDVLYGKVWVSKNNHSILKAEWNPNAMLNYSDIIEAAKQMRARPALRLTTEYGMEKNGIRFPTRYVVEELYELNSPRWAMVKKSDVTVQYKDYRFFQVETEVNIKKTP